jgi:hypothetical protein
VRHRCAVGRVGTIAHQIFDPALVWFCLFKNGSLKNELRGCIRKNHMNFYIFMRMNPSQGVAQ